MSERPESPPLDPVRQKFILHWGEMGYRWGVNRTVAQIHALLLLAESPLRADQIADALQIARSNASNSLWELQNWGIVRLLHLPGDRRDHFEAIQDIPEMFRVITRERKKREIDPTLVMLGDSVAEAARQKPSQPHLQKRLGDLLDFFQLGASVFAQLENLPPPALLKIARSLDRILRFLGLKKRGATASKPA